MLAMLEAKKHFKKLLYLVTLPSNQIPIQERIRTDHILLAHLLITIRFRFALEHFRRLTRSFHSVTHITHTRLYTAFPS